MLIKVSPRKDKEKFSAKKVGSDFSDVLDDVKAKYYSFLVAQVSDAFYGVGNILIPEEVVPAQPAME